MKKSHQTYELVFDYPSSYIFTNDCLEKCTDNEIHICLIAAEGYGSSKICEYVTGDEIIKSEEQLNDYFKKLENVTEIHSHQSISINDFKDMVKEKFRQLYKE